MNNHISSKYQISHQNKGYSNKYPLLKETQKILDRAKSEGFALPSDNTIAGINVLIREQIKNGIWNKLDDFFQYSYNNENNYIPDSSNFASNSWPSGNATKTPNTIETTAPDGTYSACKFDDTNAVGEEPANIVKINNKAPSNNNVFSIYTKAGTGTSQRRFRLRNHTLGQALPIVRLDYTTGEIFTSSGNEWTVEYIGDGWYRLSFTFTASEGDHIWLYNGRTDPEPLGNDIWYIWGAKIESGDMPTGFKYDMYEFSKINWKKPESELATVYGGCSYTSIGWEGDGNDGYIDTQFNPSHINTNKYQLNDASISLVVHKEYTIPGRTNLTGLTINSNNWIGNADNLSHRINTGYYPDTSVDFSGVGLKSMIRYGEFDCSYINRDNLQQRQVESNIYYGWNDTQKLLRRLDSYGDAGICCFFAGKSLSYAETQIFRTLYNNYLEKINLPQIA
ncbi:hypothetical protein GCM10007424_24920 [Flavobacterium suaedae]|uniref:Uncharacterized protein n=1 Tax=Flavobacterium suaedae TaxID=1767027 RepID=A0ABQ1K4C6_9FLAO|nr:hypothetical protein [Flavobacterium suaedae]GGB83924.1 hypothetical protein GCM10007424_24920 [Flavobacterium suaedae]